MSEWIQTLKNENKNKKLVGRLASECLLNGMQAFVGVVSAINVTYQTTMRMMDWDS